MRLSLNADGKQAYQKALLLPAEVLSKVLETKFDKRYVPKLNPQNSCCILF
jgi:hypothetical protein